MNLPDFCSIVSMPEWICPPPAPSFEDQVVTTFFSNAPFIVAAGAGSVLMLSPWANRNVRLIANGLLMSASLATAGGATLVASTVDVATRAVVGLGGLVYGARNIQREMNDQPQAKPSPSPEQTNQYNPPLLKDHDDEDRIIENDRTTIMENLILETMEYPRVEHLMGLKIWKFELLCTSGSIDLNNLNKEDMELIGSLFLDLSTFTYLYWKKVSEHRDTLERLLPNSTNDEKLSQLVNRINNPIFNLRSPFFYAHRLYSAVKPALSGYEYNPTHTHPGRLWRNIFNNHCKKFRELIIGTQIEEDVKKDNFIYWEATQTDLSPENGMVATLSNSYPIF